jgi:hypothetical protein
MAVWDMYCMYEKLKKQVTANQKEILGKIIKIQKKSKHGPTT